MKRPNAGKPGTLVRDVLVRPLDRPAFTLPAGTHVRVYQGCRGAAPHRVSLITVDAEIAFWADVTDVEFS